MLDFLVGKRRWPIALDIGTDCVKMLQMQSAGGNMSVRASGHWQIPQGEPRAGEQWRKQVVRAVQEMLQRGNFSGKRVITALSSNDLMIKNVRLPIMSPAETDEAIHWEAKERFGCDFAPDQLHFLLAGQIRQGADSCQEVIIIASPGEVVEARLEMLSEMGLTPEYIDAEPQAMFRPFERRLRRRADENEISVVVDLGHSSTKVVVGRGRDIVLIKKIEIGGKDLAEAVAKQLGLTVEEAADLRLQIIGEHASSERVSEGEEMTTDPNSTSWTIIDAVRGKVEELGREVALCLRYCSVTFRGLRPRRVMLTGGQAYDPAVMKLLGEQLNIECRVARPMRGIDTSGADLAGDRRGMLAEWNLCAGLAFRSAQYERSVRKNDHERDRLSA